MASKSNDGFRDFKGVFIPKEVWLTSQLTANEKLLWAEINSLDREFGCVAGNDHFEKMMNLSERQVRDYIKRLKDKGFITVELNKAKNTRVMHIAGKYARVSDDKLHELDSLRKELIERYTQHE